jgi:hypothetical protein
MTKPIEQRELANGQTLKIYQDEDPGSPRQWDNLGTMVCFHDRYKLGDEHDLDTASFDGWSEMHDHIVKELDAGVIFPLYLMDHGSLAMQTGPFGCRWDSGQVGFIYCTKGKILAEYGDLSDESVNHAIDCLEAEVKTYDQYLRGEVYGYVISDADGGEVDSCWGFIGMEHMMDELRSHTL